MPLAPPLAPGSPPAHPTLPPFLPVTAGLHCCLIVVWCFLYVCRAFGEHSPALRRQRLGRPPLPGLNSSGGGRAPPGRLSLARAAAADPFLMPRWPRPRRAPLDNRRWARLCRLISPLARARLCCSISSLPEFVGALRSSPASSYLAGVCVLAGGGTRLFFIYVCSDLIAFYLCVQGPNCLLFVYMQGPNCFLFVYLGAFVQILDLRSISQHI
jgi:hypothetical protein